MTFEDLVLTKNHHEGADDGIDAMEAASILAGVPQTGFPSCACPVIAQFVGTGQRAMPDRTGQRLIAYLPRIIGSVSSSHRNARGEIAARATGSNFLWRALKAAKVAERAPQIGNLAEKVRAAFSADDWGLAKDAARDAYFAATSFSNLSHELAVQGAAKAAASAAFDRATDNPNADFCAASTCCYAAEFAALIAGEDEVWFAWFATLDAMLAAGPQGGGITMEMQKRIEAHKPKTA